MEREDGSCRSPSFRALMWSQSFGALNDNLFRTVLKLLLTAKFVGTTGGATYLSIAQGLFVLPFIAFSGYAGYCSDRYAKSQVLKIAKFAEIIVALLALFFFTIESVWGLFLAIFLMGAHSAFFSPPKYGVLPEILDDEELSKGNGYLEFWTFLAIVFGIVLGGFLKTIGGENGYALPGYLILALSIFGFVAALRVRPLIAQKPDLPFDPNPFRQSSESFRELSKYRGLLLTLFAMSYFWFVATCFDLLIYLYAKRHLELGDAGTSALLTAMMLGIGFGSVVAGKVSEGKVEIGLIPIGGIGIGLSCMLLAFSSGSVILTAILLIILGVSAGYFIVPLNAYFQAESPSDQLGRYLGLSNLTSFTGMLMATVLVAVLTDLADLSPRVVFMLVGILSVGVAIYITKTLPGALLRCINWIFTHVVYRIRIVGEANIPRTGGALLVANHVSFVDAMLVLSVARRPVRFLIFRPIYENRWIRPIAEALDAIPIGGEGGSRSAIEEARKSIAEGKLVCIFAEGAITRIGHLLPFKPGLEKIMLGQEGPAGAPIIPLYLDELWGSIFSFSEGKFLWKIPKEIPYPITVNIGKPMPGGSSAQAVRAEVQMLSSESFLLRKRKHRLLHLGFLAQAKRTPLRRAVSDTLGQELRYFELLAGVLLLRKALLPRCAPGEKVGVLLPPSAVGAMTNLALLTVGAVPVNLNHTASKDAFKRMIEKSEIRTILTAVKYLEKIEVERIPQMLPVEAMLSAVEKRERIAFAAAALLLPRFLLQKLFFKTEAEPGDLATVMFSSGSTGDPKGVMLTHANIASNLEALYELLQLGEKDVMLGCLPLFHSFGFTGTLFLPLLGGVTAVYHPNPVDAGQVTKLIRKHRVTMLMTTPTFLQLYARKAERADLASLRYIVVGAEKLRESQRVAFEEKFGLQPLEGYGCTELSPVALVNVPDFGKGRDLQRGNKPGSAGHPIPGVTVRIADPDTLEELPVGHAGMLLVKGPNVMKGYLDDPAKTAEVLRDGFYITGDIAALDDEGFVTIHDRLSRFSKIGGEMVPHIRIEEEILDQLGSSEQVIAVTAVPDEKKGERIVVLGTVEMEPPKIIAALGAKGLPNLWIPKAEDFYRIDAIPVLGTGKMDLRGVKELAKAIAGGATAPEPQIAAPPA